MNETKPPVSRPALRAVILAAGQGTRMGSPLPKVLHPVLGRPMLAAPIELARQMSCIDIAVVVGHQRELVDAYLDDAFAGAPLSRYVQTELRGTADAVRAALPAFEDASGAVMILYGDVPNIRLADVQALWSAYTSNPTPIALLTAIDREEHHYGRLLRDENGAPRCIREYKEASDEERAVREVNLGIYIVDAAFLRDGLRETRASTKTREFYLTDLIEIAYQRSTPACVVVAPDIASLHGVNTRAQLMRANQVAMSQRVMELVASGATILRPDTVWLDATVTVGHGVTLEPGVVLRGATRIGDSAYVEAGVRLEDVEVPPGARVTTSPATIIPPKERGTGDA